jgi:iron complex transport system ATP-binding protein
MPSLTARSICFRYFSQDRPVLKNVTLQVVPGEILVLLGANGAGKSTLLRTLAGQLEPNAGQVLLDDANLNTLTRRQIAQRVCLMPQFEAPDSQLCVRDHVQLGRAPHRGWWLPMTIEDSQAINDALARMQLEDLADRPATTLSGGQFRRMVLARALAQQAQILLLDEPTSGLDLRFQYQAMNQLKCLAKQSGISIAISLHDLNLASIYADKIAILLDGELMCLGTAIEVITPANILKAFDVHVNVISQAGLTVPIAVPVPPGMHDSPAR